MNKNSKKKVLIAAVLAGVLLLGAIVSIVLVIAAQQQNISSNIRITYSVDGVGAKVSAKYGAVKKIGETSLTSMTTADGGSTELNFSVFETNDGAMLTPNGDIALSTETATEVVFEYRFENTADTLFTVGMSSVGLANNIAETYYVSAEPLETNEYGRVVEPLLDGEGDGEKVIPKQAILSATTPGNVIYIYVKVAVANINRVASYEKEYNWELKQLTTEQVPFDLALNNGDGSGANNIKVVKGAAVPVMASLPSAPAGKGFAGYYDAQTDGNLVVSKNGIGVKEINTETTLYARYDEASVLDTTGTTLYGISPTANASGVTTVKVPATVTEIAPGAFENNTSITEVVVGGDAAQTTGYASASALKTIGAKAFKGCTSLTEVIFADNIALKTIGAEAFKGCSKITELIIPKGVKTIGIRAFNGCSEMTELIVPNTVTKIETNAFSDCQNLTKLVYEGDYGSWVNITSDKTVVSNNSIIEVDDMYYIRSQTELDIYKNLSESEKEKYKVVVVESITSIPQNAFTGNDKIRKLIIKEGVTSIATGALQNISSLTHLILPSTITTIESGLLTGCNNLTKIAINADLLQSGTSSDINCGLQRIVGNIYSKITDVEIIGGTTIGAYAFYKCSSLTSVVIGSSITKISNSAFSNCKSLVSVIIGDSVQSIGGEYVFSQCSSLTEITIPDSVTTIGNYTFSNCTALSIVKIGNSVTSIGANAFNGCNNLTYNEYDNALYLGNENNPYTVLIKAKDTTITSCIINENTNYIGYRAFYNCTNLTTITIPDMIVSIDSGAFYNCTNLAGLIIPDSVKNIGGSAFYKCISLTSVTIPNSVTSIGANAFNGCTNLASVIIGNAVEILEDYTFSSCTNLASLIIGNSVKKIGFQTFYKCTSLTTVTIPDSAISIDCRAFSGCSSLVYTEYSNAKYLGSSNNPYHVLMDVIDDTLTSYEINESTKCIAGLAFIDCANLTTITIPDSVKVIGNRAFEDCTSITSIQISNSVETIEHGAFNGCTSLTSITIPESVTLIEYEIIKGCTKLTNVYFSNTTGWKMYKDETLTTGYSITVTNSSTNASRLKNVIFSTFTSTSTNWGRYYLKRAV